MSDQIDQPYNAFTDFINRTLDMDGVDGICFETVALAMREVVKALPPDADGTLWSDQLDRLQNTLRLCLSIETVGHLIRENPQLADMNPYDLDVIVTESITLAYIAYNQLAERFGFEPNHTRSNTRRLWMALRSTRGWLAQAAARGDIVAEKMNADVGALLDELRPQDWKNHTRLLGD